MAASMDRTWEHSLITPDQPALVLAPMAGITDAPMRALQGELGGFSFAVSEFLRVSNGQIPRKVFLRDVPELRSGCLTPTGLHVQVQILGGDPELMALSAQNAVKAGATSIDINFGCPAPTVNRHDGGASLLRHPERIYSIVKAVREALPQTVPVSAKLRLGWDDIEQIHENASRAAEGGASWLTIHGRTRLQGYQPPALWKPIGVVRQRLGLPVVANGDIWTLDDFRRCRDETGCRHFMLGRGTLANPNLVGDLAKDLGLPFEWRAPDWVRLINGFIRWAEAYGVTSQNYLLQRTKQWLSLASSHGDYIGFERIKRCKTLDEAMSVIAA